MEFTLQFGCPGQSIAAVHSHLLFFIWLFYELTSAQIDATHARLPGGVVDWLRRP